jgi:hypothetical protein
MNSKKKKKPLAFKTEERRAKMTFGCLKIEDERRMTKKRELNFYFIKTNYIN